MIFKLIFAVVTKLEDGGDTPYLCSTATVSRIHICMTDSEISTTTSYFFIVTFNLSCTVTKYSFLENLK